MKPVAQIRHRLPHRLRLCIPLKRRDEAFFSHIKIVIDQIDGVDLTQVNCLSGGIVIDHTACSSEVLLERLDRCELFKMDTDQQESIGQPLSGPMPASQPFLNIQDPHRDIWRALLALLLLALAIQQILRGNIMVPAISLLWYALEILSKKI
jgi:hypothetical protein